MVAVASKSMVSLDSRSLGAAHVQSVLRNGQQGLTPLFLPVIQRGDTKVGTETSEHGGRVWG